MNLFRSFVAAIAMSLGMAGSASAVTIFTETGDAGDSLATAADATGVPGLGRIVGSVSLEPNRGPDFVDIFALMFPAGGKLSAITGRVFDPMLIADPVLYLFDAKGLGLFP